jgi:hypothetical protein
LRRVARPVHQCGLLLPGLHVLQTPGRLPTVKSNKGIETAMTPEAGMLQHVSH